jgi:hypothetical protein
LDVVSGTYAWGVEDFMAGRVVLGAIRVQEVVQRSGRVSFTILGVDGRALGSADRFLRSFDGGTNRTYAYLLVDHLRWLDFEALSSESVKLADLHRYLGALGAEHAGPYGRPWRVGKRPYGQSSLETTAVNTGRTLTRSVRGRF